ncbi:MAG TPA: PAS domain S-box protein [Methanobacteriaceae archaeon]|nr:PAS domain S-box protein [Methanobacteriaceae archaeon]
MDDQKKKTSKTLEEVTTVSESKIEETLKDIEERYRMLFDSHPNYNFILGLDGKIIDINEQAAQISGLSKKDVVGKPFTDLAKYFGDGEDPAKYMELFSLLLAGLDIKPMELKIRAKEGLNRWLKLYPVVLKKDEKPFAVQIVATDITIQKEAEKKLEFQANILKNVQEPVVVTDLNGNIIYWNHVAVSLFGYTTVDVKGKNLAIIFPNVDEETILTILKGLVKGSGLGDYQCQKNSGPMLWVQMNTNPVLDFKGDTLGFINVFKDITDRKKAENELNASLREKEMLLGEINKRVKNYMQMISGLLELQSIYMEDEKDRETLHDGQNRLKAMLLIHEGLSKSEDLAVVDFSRFVKKLKKHLLGFYDLEEEQVNLKTKFDGIMLDIDTAIPCGLIANELLTKSFKQISNGKSVDICMELGIDPSGNYHMRYEDLSKGVSGRLISDDDNSMLLLRTLVNQMGGDMKLYDVKPVFEAFWFNPEYLEE